MNKEDFLEVLDQFFRRRPPLAALMWHEENLGAGKTFTVPEGKIYEVYIFLASGDVAVDEKNRWVCFNPSAVSFWFPCLITATSVYEFVNIDPATGDVSGGTSTYADVICKLPKGWILSEGKSIKCGAAFVVQWCDVTDIPF